MPPRSPFLAAVGLASGLLFAASVPAQHHLYTWNGTAKWESFGWALDRAGDLNRDGHDDLIMGSYLDQAGGSSAGSARVYSGRDGHMMFRLVGAKYSLFGASVDGVGDLNNDGHPDIVIGAYGSGPVAGEVFVFSGKDGAKIFSVKDTATGTHFGYKVRGAGDVDGDTWPDLIVGAPNDSRVIEQAGVVYVISGKGKSILRSWKGTVKDQGLGAAVCAPGDLNRDGRADVVFSSPTDSTGRGTVFAYSGKDWSLLFQVQGKAPWALLGTVLAEAGDIDKDGHPDLLATSGETVYVLSGKDGSEVRRLPPAVAGGQFGKATGGGGDVNGDGYLDVIIGSPAEKYGGIYPGAARVYSGKDWSLLFTFRGSNNNMAFGHAVALPGDLNADGPCDMAVGAFQHSSPQQYCGLATVLSGQRLSNSTDTHEVSLSRGGLQKMTLAAPSSHGQKIYLMLGSMTGTSPGLKLGAVTLPLNPDAYFSLLLGSPNTLILGSVGLLDAQGNGKSTFALPKGLPASLEKTVLHHAYVVMQAAPLSFDFASNPSTVRLIK